MTIKHHEALREITGEWPEVLGYNRTIAKEEADVAATVEGNPFIAFGTYGEAGSAVFTTDCAPHWAPPEFCEWDCYDKVWKGILDWLTK